MQFFIPMAFNDVSHYLPIARAAEECGYTGIAVCDHVAMPSRIESRYPYVPDGKPFWEPTVDWPEPWSAISAMAAVTERLRFVTYVYIMPLRHPITTAKGVATAACLSGNRLSLGVGLGWMREEFEALEMTFKARGSRTDEGVEVFRKLMTGDVVGHEGHHYNFEPLRISPVPDQPVPILIGGVSPKALGRAARLGDGWMSVSHSFAELAGMIATLEEGRKAAGRHDLPFEIFGACDEVGDADGYKRLSEAGVASTPVLPWRYYKTDDESLDAKLGAIERFAGDVIANAS